MSEEQAQLSERESEILRLLASGASNQQIANDLSISINTVKVHVRNIFSKINVTSRTEATLFALRSGMVTVGGQQAPTLIQEPPPVILPVDEPQPVNPAPADLPLADDLAAAAWQTPPQLPAEPSPHAEQATVPALPELSQPAPAEPARQTLSADLSVSPTPWLRRYGPWIGLVLLLLLVLGLGAALLAGGQLSGPAVASPTTIQAARWQPFAPLPQPRSFFALSSYNRQLYAIGGRSGTVLTPAVERYDPDVDTWVQLTAKPTPVDHVQAAVIGGKIYVPGGETADGAVSRAFEAYDPSRDVWETLSELPEARSRYALVGFEGKLYLLGGWDGSTYRAEVWRYDPDSRQWQTDLPPLPTARRSAAAGVVEGRIYVVGGENERGALSVSERLDPAQPAQGGQTWTTAVPLPQPVATPTAAAIANILLVFDPALSGGLQYFPVLDKWQEFELAQPGGVTIQAAPLDNNVLLLQSGAADLNLLTGYPVYTMSLPITP